jgi:hypothetical protein
MTKHELAAATWREMKEQLAEFEEAGIRTSNNEAVDLMMIAIIENSYVAAVAAVEEETEDPLCMTDNTKLVISKETEGRIKVSSNSFDNRGGSVIFKPGELMVLRPDPQGAKITKRQG